MCFPYPEPGTAAAVLAAVSPENDGYVEAVLESSTIVFKLSAESAATLRNTADDLLACIKVAEASLGIAGGPEPSEEDEE